MRNRKYSKLPFDTKRQFLKNKIFWDYPWSFKWIKGGIRFAKIRFISLPRHFGIGAIAKRDRITALACPSISGINGVYAAEGDKFKITGMFFGAKAPKIYVECKIVSSGGKETYRYFNCKLVKDETYIFKNASGKANSSCMKILVDDNPESALGLPVGGSVVTALYPKLGDAVPTGYLMLNNAPGISILAFPK